MPDPDNPPVDSEDPSPPPPKWPIVWKDRHTFADPVLEEIIEVMGQIGQEAPGADLFQLANLVKALAGRTAQLASVLRQVLAQLGVPYDWEKWAADMREQSPAAVADQADAVLKGLDTLLGKWVV